MDLAYSCTDTVDIDGQEYDIDLSFDNVLRLFDLLNDNEIDDKTQIETGLYMLLDVELEMDIHKKADIFNELFKQTIAGKKDDDDVEYDIEGNPMPSIDNNDDGDDAVYDFKQDAAYIYASFWQCYGINLYEQHGKLHWEQFSALLGGLSDDTIFKTVVGIRAAELPTGKGTAKERERLIKQKKRFKLRNKPIAEDAE